VLVRRFGLRPDTEGAGQHRGGFGVEYDLQIRHPSAVVVMRGKDRHRFCAWGAAGGHAGTTSGNHGERPGQAPHDIGKQTVYRAAMDEVIHLWSGGGGGWGDPLERDPDAVAQDVAAGLVSLLRARSVYGVVFADGAVQTAETRALRSERAMSRGTLSAFDFGPGRRTWEASFGTAADRIAAWLPSLPEGVRRHAQSAVYQRLQDSGPGPHDAAATERAIGAVAATLPTNPERIP
jgi:N-methylhydantoinase B